jgi:hypothetical protein
MLYLSTSFYDIIVLRTLKGQNAPHDNGPLILPQLLLSRLATAEEELQLYSALQAFALPEEHHVPATGT